MTYPSFTSGDILTATDMNAVGLWLVKTQTVGTGVSSVVVTDCFSTNYDNYKIIYSGGVGSTAQDISMVLGSTTANYYWVDVASNYATGALTTTASNAVSNAYWRVGKITTDGALVNMDLINPFLTKRTFFNSSAAFAAGSGTANFVYNGGFLNNATSYTGFTLNPISSTLTGGTIRIYGYRN